MPEISEQLIEQYVNLTKADVGLGNVDNTSDANKPISALARLEFQRLESLIDGGGVIDPPPVDTTPPTITTAASHTVAENVGFSIVLAANEVVTWSKLTGAPDHALFTLSGSTLSMAAKDYETPIDNGANNTYQCQVQATDVSGNFSTLTLTVTITDVAEGGTPPSFTSSATQTVNNTDPYALEITTNEPCNITILSGLDKDLFDIDTSTTGAIAFNPDSPTDNGGNNVYELTLRATSIATGLTKDQNLAITVTKPVSTANLFQKPLELNDTSVWKRGNIAFSVNAGVAASGDQTAELVAPPYASASFIEFYQIVSVQQNVTYDISLEVKASGKTKMAMQLGAGFNYANIWFDLVAGTTNVSGTGITATITTLTNGWFRIKTRKMATSTQATNVVAFDVTDSMTGYACELNGPDGMLVNNAQMNAVP